MKKGIYWGTPRIIKQLCIINKISDKTFAMLTCRKWNYQELQFLLIIRFSVWMFWNLLTYELEFSLSFIKVLFLPNVPTFWSLNFAVLQKIEFLLSLIIYVKKHQRCWKTNWQKSFSGSKTCNRFKESIFIQDNPLCLMSYGINKLVISYRKTQQ